MTLTWNGNARSDGAFVVQTFDGNWVVLYPDGSSLKCCPCCECLLVSAEEARAVADALMEHGAGYSA